MALVRTVPLALAQVQTLVVSPFDSALVHLVPRLYPVVLVHIPTEEGERTLASIQFKLCRRQFTEGVPVKCFFTSFFHQRTPS